MEISKRTFGIAFVILALLVTGSGAIAYKQGGKARPASNSEQADQHPLLARRVFSQNPNDPLINFGPLREELSNYYVSNNLVGSLYFEYLPTGVAVHVRGDEMKAAASLLKVPLAMEIYKAIESGKLTPSQKITLTQPMLDNAFGTLYQKGAGYTLTVQDAVRIMLVESDNTAVKALSATLGNSLPNGESVFNYLDTAVQQDADFSVLIGARGYSSILKCLYFACYLNPEHSETVLQHLSQTNFKNRLVAGVADKKIKIAHKIGVFQETTQSDCGIIYKEARPYILCVMIDGQDNQKTDWHISELSKRVYNYVNKQ